MMFALVALLWHNMTSLFCNFLWTLATLMILLFVAALEFVVFAIRLC